MSSILHLQRLIPTVSATEFNVALASSVSNVCPMPMPGDDLHQVSMD